MCRSMQRAFTTLNDRSGAGKPAGSRIGRMASCAILIAAAALAAMTIDSSARAQSKTQPPAEAVTTFHGATNEVIVPVTATDSKGRFISDLVQSDFHIFDEGREQKIDYFSHEEKQPVVIGFIIDMSNNMKVNWKRYKESTTELMLNLLPGDKRYSGYLITYGTNAELITNTSSDAEAMVRKDDQDEASGGGGSRCSTRSIWHAPAANLLKVSLTSPGVSSSSSVTVTIPPARRHWRKCRKSRSVTW